MKLPPPDSEDEPIRPHPPPSDLLMDLDLDLDTPWPLDQIFATASASNPTSPFLVSCSDQPYSPLWAFSDDNNNGAAFVAGPALRLSDSSRILSYANNPDTVSEAAYDNDDKRKLLPSPFMGLMPIDNPDGSCIIKQRLAQALRHFKDSTEQHVLAQVWAPVRKGGRYVLTTSGQPFVLDPNSNGLHQYRLISLSYMFSVDGDTDGSQGLPGRVFLQKLPEWTPNVQYYSSKEFPRLNHALNYNVRGTLALPVLEPSGQFCVGVLELIMTSQKINYAAEVDKVCKALEAVNLKSSDILLDHQNIQQICNEGRQNALAEILEIITVVCETHTLPLAQTWVPCRHGSVLANGGGFKKTCSSFDGSCMGQVCMSTTDVAFYVVDAHMWGFREACAEHHLQKGQGVAGRAFASRNSCFCQDISKFGKNEYPLVHYARMFGLRSSFAICLQSNHTGNDDYVLEFFLPPNIEIYKDQHALLDSVLITMKQHFGSLRVASAKDLDHEWRFMEIIRASVDDKLDLRPCFDAISPPRPTSALNGEIVHHDASDGQLVKGDVSIGNGNSGCPTEAQPAASVAVAKDTAKKPERKRGKAEKTISLEVLQQYFAGSLKDAAKSLGVCPTTMKRICRQHGISRWPSRKINKVNRSLSKLKRVIESVQGGEGTFSLTSLAPSTIPVTVGPISWAANLNGPNQQGSPGAGPSHQYHDDKNEVAIAKVPGADEPAEASGHIVGNLSPGNEQLAPHRNGFLRGEGSNPGTGSREESTGTPTSQGSCQGSPSLRNEASPQNAPVVSPINTEVGGARELACQATGEINLCKAFRSPGNLTSPKEEFRGMLIEDAGSSHDLLNLCPPGEALFDDHVTEYSWTKHPYPDPMPKDALPALANNTERLHARTEVNTITIKATYREDIIRFRLPMDSGILKLKEEVAKRFRLELGIFDIKYLDDDHEWVLIACDADLLECIEISKSSGSNITRLLVQDITANLGSSCESSGE